MTIRFCKTAQAHRTKILRLTDIHPSTGSKEKAAGRRPRSVLTGGWSTFHLTQLKAEPKIP